MKVEFKRTKFSVFDTAPDQKAATGPGEITILAAGALNIDRGQEIISPNAYAKHLENFSKTGKILIDHGRSVRDIAAKVVHAYEQKRGLIVDAVFSGDELGQWAREKAKEKSIDTVSIGHFVHAFRMLEKESEVRELWENEAYDPSPYDLKMLARGPVRLLTELEPVEASFVVTPMNPVAQVQEVKSILAELETKKGSMLNRVNKDAIMSIYRLAKSILRSAKLEDVDESQDAKSQDGPRDEVPAITKAKSKSRTDLLKLKLKLVELDRKLQS